MGKYDNLDREYFSSREHMAELISNTLLRGSLKMEAEELQPLVTSYPSLVSDSGMMERDVLMQSKKHRIKYGLEIETGTDYGMPRRIMVYDAGEYERNARELQRIRERNKELVTFHELKSGMKKNDGYDPCITMVLYLGQGHYEGRIRLKECLRLPEGMRYYLDSKIQNYTFPVIEADYVNPNDYHSELRQFFKAMQCRGDREKLYKLFEEEEFQNLSTDTQKIIALHLNNKKLINKVLEEEEDMCKAMRDLEKYLKEEGREEGVLISIRNLMDSLCINAFQAMDYLKVDESKRDEYAGILHTKQ